MWHESAQEKANVLLAESMESVSYTHLSQANEMIDRYIHFYNPERIQLKTGAAPLARRLSY